MPMSLATSENCTVEQFLPLVLISCMFLMGCGQSRPPSYPVKGIVTFKDKPLPYGAILFHGPHGREVSGATIDSNGFYSLNAVEGQHSVTIVARPPVDLPTGESLETTSISVRPKRGMPVVPPKYGNSTTSGLYCTVFPEENAHDFEIP